MSHVHTSNQTKQDFRVTPFRISRNSLRENCVKNTLSGGTNTWPIVCYRLEKTAMEKRRLNSFIKHILKGDEQNTVQRELFTVYDVGIAT